MLRVHAGRGRVVISPVALALDAAAFAAGYALAWLVRLAVVAFERLYGSGL